MTQPLYNALLNVGSHPNVGVGSSSIGTTLVVANLNSGALNVPTADDPGDPWTAWAGQSGEQEIISSRSSESGIVSGFTVTVPNHANIRPIVVPGMGQYADIFHIWRGNRTVTTAPRIKVYGRIPPGQTGRMEDRKWPSDDDSAFPDVADFWVPLVEPGESNTYMEFGTAAAGRYLEDMFISKNRYVYLAGCTHLMVFISQASVISETQIISASSVNSTISEFSSSSLAGQDTSYGLIGLRLCG